MSNSKRRIVINTGPILALVAATSSLHVLRHLFREVVVPLEVQREIASGTRDFGKREFQEADFLTKRPEKVSLSRILGNTLDLGEASVIQTAMDLEIDTVCIDEAVGRRIARLHDMKLTGSVGILIAAKKAGVILSVRESIIQMKKAGVWLSNRVIVHALKLANEEPL